MKLDNRIILILVAAIGIYAIFLFISDYNIISEKIKSAIASTSVGSLSEPILLDDAILIFKIRDKRKMKNNLSLEETKNQLVKSEKLKILGRGDLTSKNPIECAKISKSAQTKLEKIGNNLNISEKS